MAFLWASTSAAAQEPKRSDLPELHAVHVNEVEIGCTDCHSIPDEPAMGMELSFTVRPGHDQCSICHDTEFEEGEFVKLCLTCHVDDSFDMGQFPSRNSSLGVFSHEKHVDPLGRVSASSGLRQDCVFCHNVEAEMNNPGLPAHKQCVACHSGSNGVTPLISRGGGEACQGCHQLSKIDHTIRFRGESEMAGMLPPWLKPASLSTVPAAPPHHEAYGGQGSGHLGERWADVKRFPHGAHVKERNGAGINCIYCHESLTVPGGEGRPAGYPGMDDCAVCHQSASRVGKENHIDRCEVCHLDIDEGTVPGHHGKLTRITHNVGFNLNHADAAREGGNYCQYCHDLQRLSGNVCADCHQVLQPDSHVAARFSETTHGRLASMDRENCTVCHESDFCIRCHNVPPRSHNPLPLYAAGLHRDQAVLNLRSCFACHTFEENCVDCHERSLRLPGLG